MTIRAQYDRLVQMKPFAETILDVLADGPLSGFEIASAINVVAPAVLEGRQGTIYPALATLEREEQIISRWSERPGGRRRVYEIPVIETLPALNVESDS